MTIRFLKPWNGYQPDAVVSGLTNESALIAGGLASYDLDGGNDGRTYEAKFATDASGNVTGLVGPDGIPFFDAGYSDPLNLTGNGYRALTRRAGVYADVIDINNLSDIEWTNGTGTLEVSREVLYDGKATLKVVMPSACTRVEIGVSSGVAFASDRADNLGVGIYLPSLTGVGVAQIYLGDSTYSTYQLSTWDLASVGVVGWNHIRFNNNAAAINEYASTNPGTINSGNVARCKVRINKSAGASLTLYLTDIAELEKSRPMILFTADDGYDEWYTWLKDQAILYRVPWALGIDKSYIDTAGFMTAAQVAEMNALDSEIFQFYSHGKNNQGYSDVGAAAYVANIIECGELLKGLGVTDPYTYHPYVKGQRGDDLDTLMLSAGVKIARLAVGVTGETYKPKVMDRLYGSHPRLKMRIGLSLQSSITLSAAKTAVDNAIAVGGVLNIMAHEFVSSGATGLQWTYADTIALMAYASKKRNAGLCDLISAKTLDKVTRPIIGHEQTGYS